MRTVKLLEARERSAKTTFAFRSMKGQTETSAMRATVTYASRVPMTLIALRGFLALEAIVRALVRTLGEHPIPARKECFARKGFANLLPHTSAKVGLGALLAVMS